MNFFHMLMFVLLTSLQTLGLGCDTQGAPSAPTTTAACAVTEATSPDLAVSLGDLEVELDEAAMWSVLATLAPYGLERYTYTFAASQVTYVWWASAEAQDKALGEFCGPQ